MTLEELAKWLEAFDECGNESRKKIIAAAAACRCLSVPHIRDGAGVCIQICPRCVADRQLDAALESCT